MTLECYTHQVHDHLGDEIHYHRLPHPRQQEHNLAFDKVVLVQAYSPTDHNLDLLTPLLRPPKSHYHQYIRNQLDRKTSYQHGA